MVCYTAQCRTVLCAVVGALIYDTLTAVTVLYYAVQYGVMYSVIWYGVIYSAVQCTV